MLRITCHKGISLKVWSRHGFGRPTQRRSVASLPLEPCVFVTDSTDPFLNLAFEDVLLEQRRVSDAKGRQLILWRNDKSVILGRNQNPWIECNIPLLRQHNIPVVRRSSGGGTVYHDLGNSNITIFAQEHVPERNLQFVIAGLKESFGLNAYISPRKDIFLNQKKISGSAYRITGKQCYHHLTLLRETDLSMLEQSLLPTISHVSTKATESVRSKVLNVTEVNPAIDHAALVECLASQFKRDFPESLTMELSTSDLISIPGVSQRLEELSAWETIFGSTPEFKQILEKNFSWGHVQMSIQCSRGKISQCDVQGPPAAVEALILLKAALEGSQYRSSSIVERIGAQLEISAALPSNDKSILDDITSWLVHTIVN